MCEFLQKIPAVHPEVKSQCGSKTTIKDAQNIEITWSASAKDVSRPVNGSLASSKWAQGL